MRLAAVALVAFSLSAPAVAQETPRAAPPPAASPQAPSSGSFAPERNVNAVSGRATRIGVYASLKPDCTSGTPPNIRIVQQAENGTVTVRPIQVQVNNRGSCLSVTARGLAAFYQAKAGFTGSDTVRLEIRSERGTTRTQTINVTVKAAGEQAI